MLDRHAETLKLSIPFDAYFRLPYSPAYMCEYYDGNAVWSYRPRMTGVRRRVAPLAGEVDQDVQVRSLDFGAHIDALADVFVGAFHRVPPMDTTHEDNRPAAARAALEYTRSGGDGDLINEACFVAFDKAQERPIGAAIVASIRPRDYESPDTPTPDFLPNLTWLFVSHWSHRRGIGTALLSRVFDALTKRGDAWLLSHLLTGNAASMLFHWRHGFELLPDPFPMRQRADRDRHTGQASVSAPVT